MDNKSPEESTDYLFLPLAAAKEDDAAATRIRGPLKRRSLRVREVKHGSTIVKITQEYNQIVVPAVLRSKAIWLLHDSMGHPGRNRTMETLRMKYYWPLMYQEVKQYTTTCRYCKLRKANNKVARVPVQIYDYSDRPNTRLHMDTAGPFPIAGAGNNYILVLKCALTKWIVLIAMRSKDMQDIMREYINNWVAHFGAPIMLITDRGTEFHNSVANQLAALWGCRRISTTPRNPRSDGQVENQMRTMKDMLQAYIKENQSDWDEHLPLVAQAYNNTVNDATGFTPYFMLHGTEMNYPAEEHLAALNTDEFHQITHRSKEVMEWCWAYVGQQVVTNSNRHNRAPVERLPFKPYQVGDWFYLRVVPKSTYKSKDEEEAIQISSKLQFRYTGPYRVHEVLLPILYKAMIHGESRTVHAINMKAASRVKLTKQQPQPDIAARVANNRDSNEETKRNERQVF